MWLYVALTKPKQKAPNPKDKGVEHNSIEITHRPSERPDQRLTILEEELKWKKRIVIEMAKLELLKIKIQRQKENKMFSKIKD